MRTRNLIHAVLAGILLGGGNLFAQQLERNALVLKVAQEQVVHNSTQWQSAWGDFSKDCINARVLVIDLRRLGDGNSIVTVKWYFIGKDFDQGKLFIYDSGESTGNIAKGGVKLAATSRDLVETREQSTELSTDLVLRTTRTHTGQQPYGWALFVEQDGRAVGETASLPELVAWTQKKLEAEEAPPPVKSKRKAKFVPQALGLVPR